MVAVQEAPRRLKTGKKRYYIESPAFSRFTRNDGLRILGAKIFLETGKVEFH
jgi:hypothetical protein